MQTFKKTCIIPVIVSLTFIISCFIPVFQVVIMTLDGGLLSITNKLLFNDNSTTIDTTNWIVNFSLSALFLFLYAISKKRWTQTIFSILSIIFLFCFISFMTGDKYENTEPYFLYFMVAGLISGLILCIAATIKNRLNHG